MVGNIRLRVPSNPITPHGAYYLLSGKKPNMTYRSYDDTAVFHLMGGMSIPDRHTAPESIRLKSLSGLMAPWAQIEQKGATQDGATFIDALYDPIDADMTVIATGKTPESTAQLIRDWIAAWDAKKPGELSFFDHNAGRWWAPVRWTRNPVDKIRGGNFTTQEFTWPFKAEDAFWRSYDHTDEFRFGFSQLDEEFNNLSNWTISYTGTGTGTVVAAPQYTGIMQSIFGDGDWEAKWSAGTNQSRTAVLRRTGFATGSDNQIAFMKLGSFPEWSIFDEAYNDIWLRMGNTETPGLNGLRLRIQRFNIEVSYFVNGVETTLRNKLIFSPAPGETWGFMAGVDGDPRKYRVLRGLDGGMVEVMTVKEPGTASNLGSSYRGMGFGMEAGSGPTVQLLPASIRSFRAGDNATQTQSGMLRRVNVGDQDMWDRYTLHGPGTFYIGSGPGTTDMVKYGPLLPNQIVQIRTDPRKRGVVDLTAVQPSPQELKWWQQAVKDFVSFASGNNASPLEEELLSKFGVQPPQGNMYSLLEGRFSQPIPPKPVAGPVQQYNVLVRVEGGNADSRIVAAGTPLRRWPL
jgi:hypothetical protein